MDINIDFDGSVVTHEYPHVGQDIGAVPVLQKLVENGHRLILFTMRSADRGISPVTEKKKMGGYKQQLIGFQIIKFLCMGYKLTLHKVIGQVLQNLMLS